MYYEPELRHDEEAQNSVLAELIRVLEEDYQKILNSVLVLVSVPEEFQTEHEFLSRQLFRAFFSYVEGTVYSLKVYAAYQSQDIGIPIDDAEWQSIIELQMVINDKGVMEERRMQIRLEPNLMYACNLLGRLIAAEPPTFKKDSWWRDFKIAQSVRDRLMHPKQLADMNIYQEDIQAVLNAHRGFNEMLSGYLGPKPWKLDGMWGPLSDQPLPPA